MRDKHLPGLFGYHIFGSIYPGYPQTQAQQLNIIHYIKYFTVCTIIQDNIQ